jgi:hypothetical protein
MTDVNAVSQLYPQCTQAGVDLSKVFVAVHAATKGNGLEYGSAVRLTFGLALWVSILIHTIGVEIYVRTQKLVDYRTGRSQSLIICLSRSEKQSLRINTGAGSCSSETMMTQ